MRDLAVSSVTPTSSNRRISLLVASSGVIMAVGPGWPPALPSCWQIALLPAPFRPMINDFRPESASR